MAPILLMGLGGMLLFFSFGFGLVAAVADGAFLLPTLILVTLGGAMVLVGYWMNRRNRLDERQRMEKALSSAKCSYCGGQNEAHSDKCQFCGAPLF